jgi:hypothetical protein
LIKLPEHLSTPRHHEARRLLMALLNYYQRLLRNLGGMIPRDALPYMSPEEAHKLLMSETGQDFGYDVERWRQWLRENRGILRLKDYQISDFD